VQLTLEALRVNEETAARNEEKAALTGQPIACGNEWREPVPGGLCQQGTKHDDGRRGVVQQQGRSADETLSAMPTKHLPAAAPNVRRKGPAEGRSP
jgi:hypothetical protein